MAEHCTRHPDIIRGKAVIELGAGAGLPSLVAAAIGAASVVVTDFPAPSLLEAVRLNVNNNVELRSLGSKL